MGTAKAHTSLRIELCSLTRALAANTHNVEIKMRTQIKMKNSILDEYISIGA